LFFLLGHSKRRGHIDPGQVLSTIRLLDQYHRLDDAKQYLALESAHGPMKAIDLTGKFRWTTGACRRW
jgi:hypothetical protein